jgi:L-ascorbate metabolism protein UlaG (beta-lactamase superfamily)
MLANEIHDAPTPVALLDVGDGERRHFGPAEAAAEEHRQDCAVAQPLGSGDVRGVEQRLRLLDG